jgi:hypothetical protein
MTDLERRVAGRLVELAKVVVTILALVLVMWAAEEAAMGVTRYAQPADRPADHR